MKITKKTKLLISALTLALAVVIASTFVGGEKKLAIDPPGGSPVFAIDPPGGMPPRG